MSTNDETHDTASESTAENAARRAVREAFAALPLDQRFIALVEVELDIVGDAAHSVFNTLSRAADEFVNAFSAAESSAQSESAPSS